MGSSVANALVPHTFTRRVEAEGVNIFYHRVIAPDLPGFGFTVVPEERDYKYSFDTLAHAMLSFTDGLGLEHYALTSSTTVLPRAFAWRFDSPLRLGAAVNLLWQQGADHVRLTRRGAAHSVTKKIEEAYRS